jgi:hypothetical protein
LGPLVVDGRTGAAVVFVSRSDARQAFLPYVRQLGRDCEVVALDDEHVAGELSY